jgi:hypothetical protein
VIKVEALRDEACGIAAERLRRAGGLMASLHTEERDAVEDVAYAVALRVAEALVQEASRSMVLADALGE